MLRSFVTVALAAAVASTPSQTTVTSTATSPDAAGCVSGTTYASRNPNATAPCEPCSTCGAGHSTISQCTRTADTVCSPNGTAVAVPPGNNATANTGLCSSVSNGAVSDAEGCSTWCASMGNLGTSVWTALSLDCRCNRPTRLDGGQCTGVAAGSIFASSAASTRSLASTPATTAAADVPMTYTVAVTFDLDFSELDDADKEALKTLAKTAFCTRIAAAGVTCVAADLVVALSAGTARRTRSHTASTTIVTVALPAGTTSAQATAITSDVNNTPVTLPLTNADGPSTTSTGASVTARPGPTGGQPSSSSSEKLSAGADVGIGLAVAFVLAVAAVVYLYRRPKTAGQAGSGSHRYEVAAVYDHVHGHGGTRARDGPRDGLIDNEVYEPGTAYAAAYG